MKPRPRVARTTRYHKLSAEPQHVGKLACSWCPDEKKKLVVALNRLNSRTAGGKTDIDYGFLRKYLRTRSLSEIESEVELLKNKVILNAKLKLEKQRTEERTVRKPIEEWTNMAASLVGTLEETISTAFSQMLIVSSTEPCTLKNGDPPQVHRPPDDGRTVPLRPMPVTVQDEHCYTKAVQSLKPPAPATRPAKVPPAPSQVFSVTNSTICPPQQQPSPTFETSPAATFGKPCANVQTASLNGQLQPTASSSAVVTTARTSIIKTTQQPTEPHPATISITPTSESSSSSLNVPLSYSAPTLDSDPGSVLATPASTSSAISSHSTPPTLSQSISATAVHSKFGRPSKYATKDSPRRFGVKYVVDFERIYRFLSVIQKPSPDCELTAMESAIVLDLLMSLPEELPLLDCNKLHEHMTKMYQCLSAPTDSNKTRRCKELDDELFTQRKAVFTQDLSRASVHQNTAGSTDSTNVTHGEGKKSATHKVDSQSTNVTPPHLNPFIVPLTLLKRR